METCGGLGVVTYGGLGVETYEGLGVETYGGLGVVTRWVMGAGVVLPVVQGGDEVEVIDHMARAGVRDDVGDGLGVAVGEVDGDVPVVHGEGGEEAGVDGGRAGKGQVSSWPRITNQTSHV